MNHAQAIFLCGLSFAISTMVALFVLGLRRESAHARRLREQARIARDADIAASIAALDMLPRPPCPWHPPPEQLRDLDCDMCGGLKSDGRPLVYLAPGFKRPVLYIVGTRH